LVITLFEKCPHSNDKPCPFAGYSLGVLRCGEMTGKLDLDENDVRLFDVCARIKMPKTHTSKKVITTNIHTSSVKPIVSKQVKVKKPNNARKPAKKINVPKTGSLF